MRRRALTHRQPKQDVDSKECPPSFFAYSSISPVIAGDMSIRIDRAIIPSGLIRSGRTYSLCLEDNGLYVIHTGPAGNNVRTSNILEKSLVSAVHKRVEKKVQAGETRLDNEPLKTLVEDKHSRLIEWRDFNEVEIKKNHSACLLKIKTLRGWKGTFCFPLDFEAVLEAFVRDINQGRGIVIS